MLAANEAVANSFRVRGEDALWRIHDAPDKDRLEEFAVLAEHYGIAIDVDERAPPRGSSACSSKLRATRPRRRCRFSCCGR